MIIKYFFNFVAIWKMKVGRSRSSADKGTLETIMNSSVTRQIGRTMAREISLGILGVFGLGGDAQHHEKTNCEKAILVLSV